MKQQEINKLLEAYFAGTISESDRRRLELHALDDPFLFDALEGGRQDDLQSIESLRSRLHRRVTPTKRRVLWLPAVAACFLLVSAVFLWNYYGDIDQVEMADNTARQKDEKILDESPKTENNSEEDINEEKDNAFVTEKPSIKKSEKVSAGAKEPESKVTKEVENTDFVVEEEADVIMQGDLNTEYSPERNETMEDAAGDLENIPPAMSDNELGASSMQVNKDEADGAFAQKERRKSSPTPRASSNNASKKFAEKRKISGVVTDDNGDVLIGANIYEENQINGTISDINGAFHLNVDPSIKKITVNYTGYESKEILLTNEDYYAVSLEENADVLSEVVVTGYGSSSSEPEMGCSEFNNYIKKNNKLPNQESHEITRGVVRLQFTVGEDGKPTDFNILDSPSSILSQRAIQLIVNSGKWSQGEVVYEITFE